MDQKSYGTPKASVSGHADNNENQNAQCSCLQKLHMRLGDMFHKIGYSVGEHPYHFIIIPFCITLVCITGLSNLIYSKDPEYLYSPTNARSWYERNVTDTLFPINYTNGFDPSRIVKFNPFARLLISAKDNQTMFRTSVWNNIMKVDKAITSLNITWEEAVHTYHDICARFAEKCIENPILNLDDIMSDIEAGTLAVNYPIMLFPLVLPFYYGEIEVNETEGVLTSAKSISLAYWLKDGNAKERERSITFEKKVLQLLNGHEFENITIKYFASLSIEDELDKNANSLVPFLFPTIIITVFITAICMFDWDWVRSKMLIGLMGIITTGLATVCSFGIMMYCQVPFTPVNLAAPFLLLGIGLDDMFVLISAWRRTDVTIDVSTRLANTYSEAAFSVTITSLTNAVSFLIGATSPFPSVSLFCLYTGISILITYIFFLTFFGGCLALAGYQEKQHKHALTFKIVKAKSEAEDLSTCYSIWCTGGINKNDPHNPIDNKPHFAMTFFKTHVARWLKIPIVKASIIGIFMLYISVAIYGCFRMKEGLEYKNMVLADSYLVDFFKLEESQFTKFPYRIQVIINEPITYSDPEVKKQLLDLHSTFENLKCIGPSRYTESWIRRFYKFLEKRPNLSANIINDTSFITILKEHFLDPNVRDYFDVVISEDETQILASRFIIQGYEIRNSNEEKDMMLAVRKVAKDAPIDVVTTHPFFLFYDQYLSVRSTILQTIAVVAASMMVISFVFIPNPFCSLWVTFSILSIITGVMGFSSLWGIKLDGISMINLIMCIGFSVDFSAHISYAYLSSKTKSPNERIEESLYNLGLPVVQSGVTTIGSMLLFLVSPSYIKLTFFKIIFLVIIFGILHALFLLPVLLSILGPDTFKKNSADKLTGNFTYSSGHEGKKIRLSHNRVHNIA